MLFLVQFLDLGGFVQLANGDQKKAGNTLTLFRTLRTSACAGEVLPQTSICATNPSPGRWS